MSLGELGECGGVRAAIVGFYGGHTIYEIGSERDAESFFQALRGSFVPNASAHEADLIDRIHRRYLSREDLARAKLVMDSARQVLSRQSMSGFESYFERFQRACDSAEAFAEAFGVYVPLRIVRASMPELMTDKNRAMEEYDSLVGPPLWLGGAGTK